MTYRAKRPERRRNGCLLWAVILVWIVLLAVLGYRAFLQPRVSQELGRQVGQQIEQPAPPASGAPAPPGGALPTVVAALPSGELRLEEAQVNQYLSDHAAALYPAEAVTVRFVPGQVIAQVRALGTTSTARVGLVAQNGRVAVVNPQLDGLLAQFISLSELSRPIEQQLNDQLAAQGRRVTDIQIESGVIVVKIDN